jgi:hypothetical protein
MLSESLKVGGDIVVSDGRLWGKRQKEGENPTEAGKMSEVKNLEDFEKD